MTTQRLVPVPAEDQRDTTGKVVRSFLAGDPLRCIAAAANISSWDGLGVLDTRIADRGEDQRSKALRNRCSATVEVLTEQAQRFQQLQTAEIEVLDIPKVLAALGVPIDVDLAVELLRSTGTYEEILRPVMQERGGIEVEIAPPTDTLSLLYVTGRHRGLKPDYEMALGMMPLSSVVEIRELLGPIYTYKQTAEILAVIETTAQAIRVGDVSGISYLDYAELAGELSWALGDATTELDVTWPVPAQDLRRRLGQGLWEAALGSAGLRPPSATDRFSTSYFVEAARAYMHAYDDFGSPKDVASYDSWTIAEMAAGRDRPSVVAIRRHFGAWESVSGAVMPPEVEDEYEGLVNSVRAENNVQEGLAKAGELISEVLANMPWNSFLSIQYADDNTQGLTPYAQAVPSADGVWFEIVSEQFLPAENWPLSASYLTGHGWSTPDNDFPNWYKDGIPHIEAGHQILEGLRYGRGCHDASKLQWHTGEFPTGPGPDGGVTLDDTLNGIVQTLSNAA